MIDLSGIARHLRLTVDQIRIAADLLEQGYQPGFIERYRADETGCLPRDILWSLKLEIDRQLRLQAARDRASKQLPKDAELDAEAENYLLRSHTEVEIEAALRAFRSRRALNQTQEADRQASLLLEKLIEYQGEPLADVTAWAAEQLAVDTATAEAALQHATRLVGTLLHSDTGLNENLRRTIQRKAEIRVQFCDTSASDAGGADEHDAADEHHAHDEDHAHDEHDAEASHEESTGADEAATASSESLASQATSQVASAEPAPPTAAPAAVATSDVFDASLPETQPQPADADSSSSSEPTADAAASEEASATPVAESAAGSTAESTSESTAESTPLTASSGDAASDSTAAVKSKTSKLSGRKEGGKGGTEGKKGKSKKPVAKMTPRQRRRRWLIAMLQPMKSLRRPLTKLTAYQQLMLGRGRRSQLVKADLEYDHGLLVAQARDAFVTDKHPLNKWFASAVAEALDGSLRAKLEQDAVADLEELAAEKLLETAADQLRQSLMQRPVRGHCILVVDAVGPKAAAVAVVAADGQVLATDEIPCSANPTTVNQNVVRLGELAHQHKVTLVALTNGPARRFLVLTLRELMKQSADSGLRWTMADRGGADAYAVSRSGLKELSAHNRRHRAAIWVARCLQNPLDELLKVDVNRLRLGSFQRELPQEPLKKLVRETIADCVCYQGLDTLHASVDQLTCVAGVAPEQAQQIARLAAAGEVKSRQELVEKVSNWPELDVRQAIGLLRVFGSEQTLDATTIHPDDYRLALRLVENTELAMPPAAPEGWTPPKPASSPAPAATDPAASTADSSAPAADTEASSADSSASSAEASATAAAESSETTTPSESTTDSSSLAAEQPQSATEAAPEASSSAESSTAADATAASSATEEPAADPAQADSASETPVASAEPQPELSFTKATDNAAADTAPASKPEYPEDLTTAAPSTPAVDVEKLARGWQVGREKLRWIASCLHEPFADPRLARPPVPLLKQMPTLQSIEPGMCVWAVVVGVADFGAFVELAPDCSGLIHISRLSSNYIEDPHQCVQVGDLVMAWVVSVDEKKNRVALTALSPTERAAAEANAAQRRAEQGEHRRRDRGGQRGESGGQRETAGGRSGAPQGHGQARDGGGRRGGGGGGRPRGGHAPGGRGGKGRPQHAKTVVVTSKKPKANITDAMKEGDEPLRSFSDLMQFYEAKRTDPPAPKGSEKPESNSESAGES